jgi:HlyD family secretion protein
MADEKDSNLFRAEALAQIASPEQLDQLMQIVTLKDWLPLASIGFLVALALVWSIVGRIPIFVQAKGLLVQDTADSNHLVSISYFPIADGKQIQPGDRVLISPETASFQEFGGIEAIVTSVSPQPVTQAAALQRTNGNSELANLIYTPASIEVIAQLKPAPDNLSGYQWSMSRGAAQISSQTPTDARVMLSEQAPITFLFPFLK